jgi:hypothetical protein
VPQAPTHQPDIDDLFEQAQQDARRARDASRQATRSLAKLRDELAARGIGLKVVEDNKARKGEGEGTA